MKRILLFLLLFSTNVFAGQVQYEGEIIEFDDELSFKDFSNFDFTEHPEYEFSNKTIYSTTFSQERLDSIIFREDTKNVTFVNCHLNNVTLPSGSNVIAPDCDGIPCWTEPLQIQNDGEAWVLNEQKQPVKPLNAALFDEVGLSKDPANIPTEKIDGSLLFKKIRENEGIKR